MCWWRKRFYLLVIVSYLQLIGAAAQVVDSTNSSPVSPVQPMPQPEYFMLHSQLIQQVNLLCRLLMQSLCAIFLLQQAK
jgi:hypothetical protein